MTKCSHNHKMFGLLGEANLCPLMHYSINKNCQETRVQTPAPIPFVFYFHTLNFNFNFL
jgi:hypothetical protein